jgi:hypothetical protein
MDPPSSARGYPTTIALEGVMKVDGRCHCGRISYEAVVDPAKVGICHCTDCQMLSGSAYRAAVPAAKETFVLRSGQPKLYVKTADSGNRRAHAFCPDCGTPVYSTAVGDSPTYTLRVGCLRQRADLRPVVQLWCQSALPWSSDLRDIPQRSRQ